MLCTIFSGNNNSFSTGEKAFIAICYVAFECFMTLVLFLLAVAQWHKFLRLWHEVITSYIFDHIKYSKSLFIYFHIVNFRMRTARNFPSFQMERIARQRNAGYVPLLISEYFRMVLYLIYV